jgi:hypothetical protein
MVGRVASRGPGMLHHVVHFALLAALAVAATPPGTDVPDNAGDLDIAAAQQGLDRLVLAMSDVAPAEVVACPLVDSSDVDASLEAAGVDAPLDEWLFEVRDGGGITCAGSHVGFEDDPSFPQLEVELSIVNGANDLDVRTGEAVTVTDLPGGTVGTCESDRFVTICEERWQQEGFQVRLLVTDRVYFDRGTASTVLGDLVPTIVANLAGEATDVADPLGDVSDAQVGSAAEGLGRFVSANADAVESDDERLDCPTIAGGEFEAAVEGAGLDVDFGDDWTALLTPVTFPAGLDPVPIRLTCTGGFDPQARIDVIDFGDQAAADDFVASVGIAEGGSAADLEPGDLTVGTCVSESGQRFCTEWWRDDGLVVGVWLVGETQSIGNDDAATVLVEVLPTILANLDTIAE